MKRNSETLHNWNQLAHAYQFLFDSVAVAVFGSGTKISDAVISILEVLLED